jgi:hypothetical protein
MPPRSWLVRIEDILEALDNIEDYVVGLDFDAFHADRKTVDAVERNLEIIGEASPSQRRSTTWMQGDHDPRRHARRAGIDPLRIWQAARIGHYLCTGGGSNPPAGTSRRKSRFARPPSRAVFCVAAPGA